MNEIHEQAPEANAKSEGFVRGFYAVVVIGIGLFLASHVYGNATGAESERPFKLGLDLAGGSHLIYEADTSNLEAEEVPELMNILRDVIERRVNIFGVAEPIVQVESSSFASEVDVERLVVELPGVTDVTEAVAEIGRTPLLEFKLLDQALAASQTNLATTTADGATTTVPQVDPFVDTGLTGRYLSSAELVFGQGNGGGLSNEAIVAVDFNSEGGDLFAEITRENVGQQLGIFLDGALVSSPVINEAITGGSAVISGNFSPEEARLLVQNLNFGALPVAIELQSTQTVGASLGAEVLEKGMAAGVIGLVLVTAFMFLWYRLPGLVAIVALSMYVVIMLALFQYIPVTLTAAGLAGFILSIGMAVDANVLVFERMKEEYRNGKGSREAAKIGFKRAWSAIRDGNITSLLSAIILFWFGTSVVKGFALVFGVGVLVSMFSAVVVTRTLLIALPDTRLETATLLAKLYTSGLTFKK